MGYMNKKHIVSILFLAVMLTACMGNPQEAAPRAVTPTSAAAAGNVRTETEALIIRVQGNGHTIIFKLNDSPASRSLYRQLPLKVKVENYSNNEKIFYPSNKLELGNTPLTKGGENGTLAYFAPWGDIVMFYDSFGPFSGLYELGTAISGDEWIRGLSGEILVESVVTQGER